MATPDVDMAREALDLADSWGDVDLDAGQIVELANALQDAWRLGRTSANDGRMEGVLSVGPAARFALDAHAECAEELRTVGCRGETTTAVMTHAVERIKRADAAEAEGNRVIEALAKRADGEAEDAREAIATLQNELGEAIATLRSLRDELRETNVLRRDSHSRLQAVRDAVRED